MPNTGLIINDIDRARKQLINTTYYDLINGYKDLFLVAKNHKSVEDQYVEGTTFEDIVNLYNLDRELRYAILELLLDVECKLYSAISYSLCEVYGEAENNYLNTNNYKAGKIQNYNNEYERDNLFRKLNSYINNPKIVPLKHYKRKYDNIPPWILVKQITFGELNMLFKLSSSDVKNKVMKYTLGRKVEDEKTKEFFTGSFKLFNDFRNLAAHGGRIYNARLKLQLPEVPLSSFNSGLYKNTTKTGYHNSNFSTLLIALLFLYKDDYEEIDGFLYKLKHILNNYKTLNPNYYEAVMINLGLNDNYEEHIFNFLSVNI